MHSLQHGVTVPGFPRSELLWTLSPQAVFRSVSPRVGTATGWGDGDWLGKPLQSFIHPFDIGAIKHRFGEVLAGNTIKFENIRCLTKHGGETAWHLSFVPEREAGVVTGVLAVGHASEAVDHTPTEARASHLMSQLPLFRDSETHPSTTIVEYAGLAKLLEGMLGNAPIGFALMDEKLHFICLNQTFSEMTGFSPPQQLGQTLRSLLPEVADVLDPVLLSVLTSGKPAINLETKMNKTTELGPPTYMQMSFYPIPDLHGGICGVATIALDISFRKQAEGKLKEISDELERSNIALEEFSYVASHDLKEPLRTVSSFVSLLNRCYGRTLDGTAKEYMSFVVDGTQRMQRLIEKLLEYSRAGKLDREVTDIDANAVLRETMHNLKVSLEESSGTITHDVLPTVHADELLLTQVIQNLVANAIKYRREHPPRIHVGAKRELNQWVFSVSDNGIGIHADYLLKVFLPFRKLHSPSEYAGSGLGLAICQKNVERLGGKIWVTSTEGEGSVFSFTVPAATGEPSTHEDIDQVG